MALNLFRLKEFASEQNYETAELHLSQDGKHFVFIYKIENKYFAQYNDKIYGAFDSIENVTFRKNGRIFAFKSSTFSKKLGLIKDENQDSLNINGRILGPFTKIRDFKFNDNITYYLWYETFGTSFVVVNNKKLGSFKTVFQVTMSSDGSSYAVIYKDGGRKYLRINEDVFGGYEDIFDFIIDYNNDFTGYLYKKETGEFYAQINSMKLGPFEKCGGLTYFSDIRSYCFEYRLNGSNHFQVNNFIFGGYGSFALEVINSKLAIISTVKEKESSYCFAVWDIGSFENVIDYKLSENGEKYIFSYKKFNQFHVITGEYEYGPYQHVSGLNISRNGMNYCYIFQKQFDNYYININGEVFGPYVSITEAAVSDTGDFGFIFTKNAKHFVNISNSIHGIYEQAWDLRIDQNGSNYCYKFSKRVKTGALFAKLLNFISINGEISENEADIIDIQKNSMGIEAIVYKKKDNWYINLNETMFGPYWSISDWKFLPDDSQFLFRFKDPQADFSNLQINAKSFYSRNKNLQIYLPIFSPDKKKYAFVHYSKTHYFVQVTDQTFGPFSYSDYPAFSPDSKIFIFKYELENGIYLNVNGMKLGPFGKAEYVFSDGKLYISYLQDKMIFIDEITW